MNKKYVLLLSGGLDSAVCLYWARAKKYKLEALIFNYGQKHSKEIKNAVRLARLNGIKYHKVKFVFDWKAGSLVDKKSELPARNLESINRQIIPSTYVPGRNLIFLGFALSLCQSINADGVIIGANQVDFSGYPDCRNEFLRSFKKTACAAGGIALSDFEVLAPLIYMGKTQIVRKAVELGVPLGMTWSCYKGGKRPCGFCDSCVIRKEAFNAAGAVDPLEAL